MSNDESDFTFRREAPPRKPQPSEHLWTFVRDGECRRAALRTFGQADAELQIYVNDQLMSARRYASRGLALGEADAIRAALEFDGWTRG
jgi:hypothetical protein